MSDAIFTRLRALLGTSGVDRDANGIPRASPDSSDALSLVCRLAHEESWKIRVEGRGTWLPPDAPADLAVSTRALEQIVPFLLQRFKLSAISDEAYASCLRGARRRLGLCADTKRQVYGDLGTKSAVQHAAKLRVYELDRGRRKECASQ